ncbi:MAG TPA: toprim domain-containing protein, partial [Bacteroidetes bacterium]|nr:toprim domain-containing protein [Bacteroidota bacterium]
TGLSIERDSHLIDRFRGRVIFPIHNLTGKVIGFGGRILTSEKSTAKYINSPDSEIYSKSRVLYGIYFSRNAIVKRDNCYLVEGYTDVISLHQAGIENVVASSGTSLTVDQIKLIKRYTPNITILYDGDPAGIKASFRGIDLILEQGMNVKIVLFPEGEDPDSFVRAHRTGEVEEFIQNQATDFIKFKTNLMMGETAGDPSGRASLIKEIISTIAQIPDGINRSVYIRECSIVMDIPEQTLMNELNKTLRRKFSKKKPGLREIPEPPEEKRTQEEQIEIDPLDVSGYEKQIMEFILQFAYKTIMVPGLEDEEEKEWQVVDYIISDFRHDQIRFENETYNEILEEYAQSLGRDQQLDEKYFIYHPKQNISQTVIQLLAEPYQLSENWKRYKIYPKKGEENMEEYFDSYILPLKSRLISKELKKITERLKTTDDEAEMFLLQQQYFELKKIANMLDERRHRIFNH